MGVGALVEIVPPEEGGVTGGQYGVPVSGDDSVAAFGREVAAADQGVVLGEKGVDSGLEIGFHRLFIFMEIFGRVVFSRFGQGEAEGGAFADFGGHLDLSAHLFDEHLADGQAEARTLCHFVALDKAVEYLS